MSGLCFLGGRGPPTPPSLGRRVGLPDVWGGGQASVQRSRHPLPPPGCRSRSLAAAQCCVGVSLCYTFSIGQDLLLQVYDPFTSVPLPPCPQLGHTWGGTEVFININLRWIRKKEIPSRMLPMVLAEASKIFLFFSV